MDDKSILLAVQGGIVSGSLEARFGNGKSSLYKDASANNIIYVFDALVTPVIINSGGMGYVRSNPRGDVDFSYEAQAENLEKHVTMVANLKERPSALRLVNSNWSDETILTEMSGSMTAAINLETIKGYNFTKAYTPWQNAPFPINRSGLGGTPMNYAQIIAGMKFEAKDANSEEDLFDRRYVPESGALNLSLRAGARGVNECVQLSMYSKWKGID